MIAGIIPIIGGVVKWASIASVAGFAAKGIHDFTNQDVVEHTLERCEKIEAKHGKLTGKIAKLQKELTEKNAKLGKKWKKLEGKELKKIQSEWKKLAKKEGKFDNKRKLRCERDCK